MNLIALAIAIAAYGVIGLSIALWARGRTFGGTEEFYLGGRAVPGLVSAASYAATTYSAFMMLGLAGLTYAGGVGALGFELVYFAGLGLVLIFGPRFLLIGKQFGVISPSEMLGVRYNSRLLASIIAALACIFLVPYSAVQLLGIGLLISGVTGGSVPVVAGIAAGAVTALVWTLMAGLRSVVWTDALQVVLVLLSAFAALWFVVDAIGGVQTFMALIEDEHGAWLHQPGPGLFDFPTFIGLTIPWLFFSISNPQVSQRLFTVGNLRALRQMIIGFLTFGLIFTLIAILWGFSGLILVPGLDDPDQVTPQLLASGIIPAWLAIPLLVGIFAAAVTTIDSIALTLASMVGRDIYRAHAPNASEGTELAIGKVATVVLIAAAALFASLQVNLIALLSVASSAGLLVVIPCLVGAFFWPRGTAAGAIASVLVGAASVSTLGLMGINPFGVPYAVVAFTVAIVLFIGVSLMTRAPADRARAFIDDLTPQLRQAGVRDGP